MGGHALVSASVPVCELEHRPDLVLVDAGGVAVADHALQAHHVRPGVEEDAVAVDAVAAGPADLLVVALDGLGHVAVDDVAHVRLVDAHAEGDGGAHDVDVVADEGVLGDGAIFCTEAGVIGQRLDPERREVLGRRLGGSS